MSISKAGAMNFILYIKCTQEQEFTYSDPFWELLKRENSTADNLDLDNFSGNDLLEYASQALATSEKCCALFQLEPGSKAGGFIKIATWLADHTEKCLVFVNGQDETLFPLLSSVMKTHHHNLSDTERIEQVKQFLR